MNYLKDLKEQFTFDQLLLIFIEIDTESATVGGWVVEQFGDIPNEGDTLMYDDSFSVEVIKTDNKRVQEIIVRPVAPQAEEEKE